ncbi:hypothetical protein LXA43DRAFT_483637 [Ganoderma leucocontextum]|nr:hypothetical protein LXA43DRAFT_483637 [Ganoderma leucocontextum]
MKRTMRIVHFVRIAMLSMSLGMFVSRYISEPFCTYPQYLVTHSILWFARGVLSHCGVRMRNPMLHLTDRLVLNIGLSWLPHLESLPPKRSLMPQD